MEVTLTFENDFADKLRAKQETAKVLTSLYSAFNNIQEESKDNPILNEALNTNRIKNGVEIFDWKIIENNKKFNILHKNDVVLEDFYNYNSAVTVVKLLESGLKLNNPKVVEILNIENKYANLYTEALLYKKYLSKTLTESKRDLYEVKFENCRIELKALKQKIESIAGSF